MADLARPELVTGVSEDRGEGVLVLGPLMFIIECDLRPQSRGWSNGVRESLEQVRFSIFLFNLFLAPIGAQGVTMSVCLSVCLSVRAAQTCLEQSIFIF